MKMEITKENFLEKLPEICDDIEKSLFISLDTEFTGLTNDNTIYRIHPFDSTSEYYEKVRHSSHGFVVVQLGITIFKIVDEKLKLKSYNFYVFPHYSTQTFLSQGSSLSFLASNGFDFNKLFSKGLSTVNIKDEEKLCQNLQDRRANRLEMKKNSLIESTTPTTEKKPMTPIPEKELNMLADAREKIQTVVDGSSPKVEFQKNGFQRKLIYEMIDSEFLNKVSTRSGNLENNRKSLIVEPKKSTEEEEEIEKNKQNEEDIQLQLKLGLRLIMKEISKSQKMIIGHNCLYDVMFLYRQCFDDLPENYDEFKKNVTKTFPKLVDTKFMASSDKLNLEFSSTILGDIYRELQELKILTEEDFQFESPDFSYENNSTKEHEAGYDSFITGYCFLAFLKHLKVDLNDEFKPSNCKQLQPYLGRLALQKIQNTYMNFNGNEPVIVRDNVFFIHFPSSWKVVDIQNQFKNFGPIQIYWVDNTSAYVTILQKEMSSCVLKNIGKTFGFEIQSFKEFKANNQNNKRKRESESSQEIPAEKEVPKEDKKEVKKRRTQETFAVTDNW